MDKLLTLIYEVKALIAQTNDISPTAVNLISEVENFFSGRIPDDLRVFLANYHRLPENVWDIFSGYEPMSLEVIASHCRDIDSSGFFSAYDVGKNFNASEECRLRIFSSLKGKVENEPEMGDMRRLLPIFDGGGGFYLSLYSNNVPDTELSIITEDFGICSYAPSLTDHLSNVETGLIKGIYTIENDGIFMPMDWYQRVMALSPEGLKVEKWNT